MTKRLDLGTAMREALPVYEASPALRAWAREEAQKLDQERAPGDQSPNRSSARFWRPAQMRIAAGLVVAALAGWGVGSLGTASRLPSLDTTTNELIDAHVRSLLPGHLLDVVSSDRHTVKPWFAGKTDIAPAVVDLSASGFPLLGGRLDYVAGHTAATLTYGRRLHTINLFIWRSGQSEGPDGALVLKGYSLLHWTSGGLSYWAVSDAAPSELEAFRQAYLK
jgi:anti-sigma factor RsiW